MPDEVIEIEVGPWIINDEGKYPSSPGIYKTVDFGNPETGMSFNPGFSYWNGSTWHKAIFSIESTLASIYSQEPYKGNKTWREPDLTEIAKLNFSIKPKRSPPKKIPHRINPPYPGVICDGMNFKEVRKYFNPPLNLDEISNDFRFAWEFKMYRWLEIQFSEELIVESVTYSSFD